MAELEKQNARLKEMVERLLSAVCSLDPFPDKHWECVGKSRQLLHELEEAEK